MLTRVRVDNRLVEDAKRVGRHKSKKEAVTVALEEYIQRRQQLQILDLFGKVDYYPDYDYKAERRRESAR